MSIIVAKQTTFFLFDFGLKHCSHLKGFSKSLLIKFPKWKKLSLVDQGAINLSGG